LACFWNISIISLSILFVVSACCFISSLKASLLLSRFSSLILASSSFAFVEDLYSSNKSFWSRSSFLNCLFSLSRRVFLCNNSSSVEADLKFTLFNQVRSSIGWTLEGITWVAVLASRHKGVLTTVLLLTSTSCKLLTTPFSQSWILF